MQSYKLRALQALTKRLRMREKQVTCFWNTSKYVLKWPNWYYSLHPKKHPSVPSPKKYYFLWELTLKFLKMNIMLWWWFTFAFCCTRCPQSKPETSRYKNVLFFFVLSTWKQMRCHAIRENKNVMLLFFTFWKPGTESVIVFIVLFFLIIWCFLNLKKK